tara:strand:- start:628 stop:867 length:240 start_codon:yes stop_codon:yes gene_type:complete
MREYEMFSAAGNRKCAAIVKKITKMKFSEPLDLNISHELKNEMHRAALTYGEIFDTEPRGNLEEAVEKAFNLPLGSIEV